MAYIYRLPDWPAFHWDPKILAAPLAAVRHRQGRLIGRMESLGFALRGEAILRTLTEDVVKSSEIEGAVLDREQVRSSVARRLGMRSEEHTSELQSLMRISYAVFCLKKKNDHTVK